MSKSSVTQLSLFTPPHVSREKRVPPKCHYKGCQEPVVGSSTKRNAYVCDKHNDLEWAQALARGKDGYWKTFGQRWLAQLREEGVA